MQNTRIIPRIRCSNDESLQSLFMFWEGSLQSGRCISCHFVVVRSVVPC